MRKKTYRSGNQSNKRDMDSKAILGSVEDIAIPSNKLTLGLKKEVSSDESKNRVKVGHVVVKFGLKKY